MNIIDNSLLLTVLIQSIIILLAFILIYYFYTLYKIAKSKTHLQTAFDSIEDPMVVVDEKYKILRTNRAYSKLTDYPYSKLIGQNCYKVLHGLTAPCIECRLKETLDTQEKTVVRFKKLHTKYEDKTISISFYPLLSTAQVGVIEHIRDITELEAMREKLVERNLSLSDTNTTLITAQKEIDNELALARQVQQNLLPQYKKPFPALTIHHIYHPIQSVGGDIYDFIHIDENKLGLFIGDVSGHGLSAAFVGTIAKMSLYQHTKHAMSTSKLLEKINIDLMHNVKTVHYLTCFWSIFDKSENSLTYSRAGHPMPIVITKDGEIFNLSASGTFLGMLETSFIEERKFYFEKGDRLFLFTDGIYEVTTNDAGADDDYSNLIGYQGFIDIIRETQSQPIKDAIPYIRTKIRPYKCEDDYTLIALEINSDSIKKPAHGFSTHQCTVTHKLNNEDDIKKAVNTIQKNMTKNGYSDLITEQTIDKIILHLNRATINECKSIELVFSIEKTKSIFSILTENSLTFKTEDKLQINDSASSISFSINNEETS